MKRTKTEEPATGFHGRSAIVIGGSRGLGRAVALALARDGARVLAVGRTAGPLAELRSIAAARELSIATARADALRPARVRALLRRAGGKAAAPDILVHAAGDYWEGPLSRLTRERWDALVASNLTSALVALREALPGMRRRRYGRILLFGVAGGDAPRAAARAHAYRALKTALLGLARSVALEEAKNGITVNCVTPAAVRTPIFEQVPQSHIDYMLAKIPMGRFGTVEEIAATVTWACTEDCSFTTGAVFDLSGGRATY